MRAASASHTGIPEVAPKRSVAPGDLARRTLLSGAGGSTLGLALAAFAGTELLASSSAWAAASVVVDSAAGPFNALTTAPVACCTL